MLRIGHGNVGSPVFFAGIVIGSLMFGPVAATEVSHGEMAGTIRSANHPCAHVLKIDSAGENKWVVQCNSGTFSVFRGQDGRYEVMQAAGNAEK